MRAAQYKAIKKVLKRRCGSCAGRGHDLDWIDHGGTMRAVPGDTCSQCGGSGEVERKQHNVPDKAHDD